MTQKTNLNISPYYDDFDQEKNYYRVLFKPGFPVQSRELTTLQSILQSQISSFANHIFKDGSVVIPGNISYDPNYYAVKLNPKHLGLDVGLYINELIGKKISGQTSGITAIVKNIITNSQSEEGYYTLYVKYLNSDTSFKINTFSDGETLITQDTFSYGNTSIVSGETICSLISLNSTATGSAVSISKGIYYVRGTFVNVDDYTLILDQYTNTPSYRIGLEVIEEIIDSQNDNSLYDNARGFANFSAPGSDRLKISTILNKKSLNDYNDKNFIEILRVTNGIVKKIQDTNTYSLIKEYIAKRTYEESGDYSLIPFDIEINNSLNDKISSDGLFFSEQKTDQGNTPNDNLLCVKVSPGKAYVRGFDIDKSSTSILDIEKPRDVEFIKTFGIPFEMGNLVKINNVSGTPLLGLDNNFYVNLQNQRKSSTTVGSGITIGNARIYSFSLADSSYSNQSSEWNLYLFDIQTYEVLTLNQPLNSSECPETSYVKGLSSGASGYVVSPPNGVEVTITQTSGTFSTGEQLEINGSKFLSRTVSAIKRYSIQDIKSLYQNKNITGLSTSFTADTVLQSKIGSNFSISDQIEISSSGIASCAGRNFVGIKSDTIIRYRRVGFLTETYNRIVSVSSDGLYASLAGVSTVNQVCDGGVPTTITNVPFTFGDPTILYSEKSSLYSPLGHKNISELDLSNSNLKLTKQIKGKSSGSLGSLSIGLADVGLTSSFYEPYDSERYSIFYEDGSIENLSNNNVSLDPGLSLVTFSGLKPNQNNITINTTIQKNSIISKQKLYVRSEKLEVNKISSAVLTSISGLSTSNYYGLRVDDKEISLNVPDVSKIVAIYESLNTSSPVLDKLSFNTSLNLDSSSILGEQIIGSSSGAIGQLVTKYSSSEIEFVYLNTNKFINGETVRFQESNIVGSIQFITVGNYLDRTQDYILDNGQKEQYYDYSKLIRKNNFSIPTKKLLIIYDCYQVPSNDSGDLYTVQSYGKERYNKDVPILNNNTRLSDVIDFRPRVSKFTNSSSSPFAFTSRDFSISGLNPTIILSPNESANIGYYYYLPRIDKLVLNKNGNFSLVKGISSINPKIPSSIDESMDIATIELPAYLYNTSDAKVKLIDNRRYTMRDVGKLEQRIENLENLSSLSLLEIDTKSLEIKDSDGFSKFKCGFFADGFKNTSFIDVENGISKFSINNNLEELESDISLYSLKSEISLSSATNIENADFSADLTLSDPNVKKTGDLITLNYAEVDWVDISQNFATKEESINPFSNVNYNGNIRLYPSSDTWVKTVLSETGSIVRSENDWKNTYISNLVTGSQYSDYTRSRNVEFSASGLIPKTQYYSFLDGNTNIDVIPKLLQISMSSGIFQTGEDVNGYIGNELVCCFRLATQTHKYGLYNSPSEVYSENPYNPAASFTNYSSSSTILNIDTKSLSDNSSGKYFGYTPTGMVLIGKTSKAQATVIPQSLISDSFGDLIGCFYIRNPLSNPTPPVLFKRNSKSFRLSSSSTNSSSISISYTETTFFASGILNSSTYSESISVRKSPPALPLNALRKDPFSQTFRTDNDGGFLTSVDLFFSNKDSAEKLFVEIRECDIGGVPKDQLVQDFARVEVLPSQIAVSSDASVPTNIKFKSPIYLQPNKQYAISIFCPTSSNYKVWIAESNNPTVTTSSLPAVLQTIYSNNYTGGHLFKPQNGSVWNSSLSEDLCFKFKKAQFVSKSGTIYFHNPSLSIGSTHGRYDSNIQNLIKNPLKALPRKLVVGIITSSNISNVLSVGTKVLEGTNFGYIEKIGGNIGIITSTNTGIGYSNGSFTSVPLYTITGSGNGATANITFINSKVSTVSIANTGSGYVVGDVLGITTSAVNKGKGATITVSSTINSDTLYLTNVQGQSFTQGNVISYYDGSTNVSLSGTTVRGQTYVEDDLYTGNVFEVTQYNHSMHSDNNILSISGVFPDTIPELLTASLPSTTLTISVANTANFVNFEGSQVSGSNLGYVLINNEIISYSGITVGGLTINKRSENDSIFRIHQVNDLVYKYEINGISLTRINTAHNMPTNSLLKSIRDLDRYHIEFNRDDKPLLSFIEEKSFGGSHCQATQNYQFNSIIPQFNLIYPNQTNVFASLRTVSGTSCSGNETSFLDQGFESVELNAVNNLSSPRMVCSRINELNNLSDSVFKNNKSLTLGITLESESSNVSPVIDTSESATFIFIRNRINSPVKNYVSDSTSHDIIFDPHQFCYVSKKISLKKPATSLKVILNAYRSSQNEFRVYYRLFKSDSDQISQSYNLFPGYNNLKDIDGDNIGDLIIDTSLNDGLSDIFVNPSTFNEFLEYQYTANELEEFNAFSIKIVANGSNEADTPRFTDIRAIALA
jgi:hypothetical protein